MFTKWIWQTTPLTLFGPPVVESRNHSYNPRTVGVGDLDGDGKHEIIFPSSNTEAEGYHIYEWDGVMGSDNYGEQPSAICAVEVQFAVVMMELDSEVITKGSLYLI